MKLEQQVCSLDLAKRLKELGVPQESLFYWGHNVGFDDYKIFFGGDCIIKFCSAFTVAELGEILKQKLMFGRISYESLGTDWTCNVRFGVEREEWFTRGNTEADARAAMLIYLLENKFLTPPTKP